MDLLEAKSRVAEALVESIFRRARYRVRPFRTEHGPLRIGREDFSPDFCVARLDDPEADELLMEVKYRPSIEQFLSVENQRGERSTFVMARKQWPNLYFVLVSDRPAPDRSCFQAVFLADHVPGAPFVTVDLQLRRELKIFRNNIDDHETLVRRVFDLLASV